MGSSFLTAIDIALAGYCVSQFIIKTIQFGLPNHPSRFTLYLVLLSAACFFFLDALADLGVLSALDYLRWRVFPLVAGSLGLLLQLITTMGYFSLTQQKIISRIPFMGAAIFFFIFPDKADIFFKVTILITVLFLTVSVGNTRYQKRMLFKMCFFLGIAGSLMAIDSFIAFCVGKVFLFPALFYFFIFEQSFGVSALIDQHYLETSGVPS